MGDDGAKDTQPSVVKVVEGKNGGTLTPWQKGTSGNPGGTPKDDVSAKIARLAFSVLNGDSQPEGCTAKAWKSATTLASQAQKNPKFYQVLSDRAFNKLKIPIEQSTPFDNMTEEQLIARLKQLRAKDDQNCLP